MAVDNLKSIADLTSGDSNKLDLMDKIKKVL